MLNGLHIRYIALLSKALYSIASHSPIHTPMAVPTMQGNNQHGQEQLGLGALLRDTSTIEPGDRTSDLPVARQPPQYNCFSFSCGLVPI